MKLSHYIILFLIIFTVPLLYVEYKYSYAKETTELNHKFEQNMTTAAQDAITTLRTNSIPHIENGYDSYKIVPTDFQPAYEAFVKSLSKNFGATDKYTIDRMERYIPVFSIIDYDGLMLNVYQEKKDANGNKVTERTWLPKIPFVYRDSEGNIINFTIDEELVVYDVQIQEWVEGTRQELLSDSLLTIDFLEDEKEFDTVRRQTIVDTIQDQIAYYINEHNVYTKQLDVTYTFTMPLIDNEEWFNTVDDISILAFFQGYPSKFENYEYQKYAFVGARVNLTDRIYAGNINGENRFWRSSCNVNVTPNEVFSSKKEAAARGYTELSCLNPTIL